ncbi:sulfurtransferase-like selenium metabolism protein YedF [candidate division KSB1 bacterium]|nr:sulfurtransferase-like selenium metabolism protein YedF [candidate division KSB1 bacterium]
MTFLYLNSDQMGHGDVELGRKLLQSFLAELAKSNIKVDVIGCVNSGIRLTISNGKALESLQALEKKGAQIATCGTCLDYHDKRDDLLIGSIGTMEQTVQIMAQADKVIRPT